jgi:pimeloyl-ACP methyl ester carboxylesterase
MPQITANGIKIEYDTHGDPGHPPMLLIMGLGAQLTLWPIELVEALVARGFYVIRHDNRDIGLSTHFDDSGAPNMLRVMATRMFGMRPSLPYQLFDMAADSMGLLDALKIDSAHIVGASMGGMIAQLIACGYPTRTRSLTSIMSTTGNRALPRATAAAMAALTERPLSADMSSVLDYGVRAARVIGSPAYPAPEARLRERIERDFRRSFHPIGAMRQMAAIMADGDRRERLRAVTAPTMVIHGLADPLVPVEGGKDTAASIRGAKLHLIPGMGHDLPLELVDEVAGKIAEVAG